MTAVYEQLRQLGFSKHYVRSQLPAWWDDELLAESSGTAQFLAIVRRQFGLRVRHNEAGEPLLSPRNINACFKTTKATDEGELNNFVQFARASTKVVLSAMEPTNVGRLHPADVRAEILQDNEQLNLHSLLQWCWKKGIPVIQLTNPPPGFKRPMGCVLNMGGRPAIVLGFRDKSPAKQLFVLAHELGHIAHGHYEAQEALVDSDIGYIEETILGQEVAAPDDMETQADDWAKALIRGNCRIPEWGALTDPLSLATEALQFSREHQVDAGHLILSHGFVHKAWDKARAALAFVEQANAIEITKAALTNALVDSLDEDIYEYINRLA
jgi:hypothetical protein